MSKLISALNPKQQVAVIYNDGPLAIIAGAGSGKTRTLTHKIAYLISEKKVDPSRILAVTFTNKAANEMKERVIKLIGEQGHKVLICTYHSLGVRILRGDIDRLGYKRNFNIIDPVDQKQILRPGYKKFGLSPRSMPYSRVIGMISKFKNNKISPQEVRVEATKDIDVAYANLYEFYLKQTKTSNNLDFDDLLLISDQLLKREKVVAAKWVERFNYVLVDEFQDTSLTQYSIIKQVSQNAIFTIVGDPDQNIYSWRFANPNLITNFSNNNKQNKTILLEQNYRSTQTILNAANKLIKNNRDRIDKNLFTINGKGLQIDYFHGFSEDSEARWVVNKIRELANSGEKKSDIVILYRSNFLTNSLEKALIQANMNYIIYGAIKFYQREEIKDVVAYLKLINDGDPVALKRVINVPSRFIGATAQDKIFTHLNRYGTNTFNLLINHFQTLDIAKKSKAALAKFVNLIIKYQQALKTNTIEDVIEKFLIEVNYESKWSSFEDQGRVNNIKELINNIANWEKENKEGTLADFLSEVSLYVDYESDALNKEETISLMTVHASKGLEFKHVFIFGMNEDVFPSQKTREEVLFNGMEEERRLAYVAVTRAKERLYISSSRGFLIDHSKQKTPSRFIKELGINPQKYSKHFIFEKSYTNNKKAVNNFIEGEKVIHDKFGKGVVMAIEGDLVRVVFKGPYGVKTIMKNHQAIRKEEG